jgi:hypothetical protein
MAEVGDSVPEVACRCAISDHTAPWLEVCLPLVPSDSITEELFATRAKQAITWPDSLNSAEL